MLLDITALQELPIPLKEFFFVFVKYIIYGAKEPKEEQSPHPPILRRQSIPLRSQGAQGVDSPHPPILRRL